MRSAGCIVNDIFDREFDKKVSRTKNRPIASNQVSIKLGIFYTLILCLLALLVLINFNNLTILLALGSMPLAFTYPLMKRFTYWPQLFLGITFNYGLVLGWTAIQGEINTVAIILALCMGTNSCLWLFKKPKWLFFLSIIIFFWISSNAFCRMHCKWYFW